jgi:hypothetical protein
MWIAIALVACLAIFIVTQLTKLHIPRAIEMAAGVVIALYVWELSSGMLHRTSFFHQQTMAMVTGWVLALAAVKLRDHK